MNDRRFHPIACWLLLCCLSGIESPARALAAGDPQAPAAQEPAAPSSSDELALSQSQLADKYRNLEKTLLRMAEYDAGLNPHRAELLLRVFSESKERQVQLQFESLVQLLQEKKLGQALGSQKQLRSDLDAMLKLLMSENRADRIKSEKARLREYIREIERLERMQRSVQGRTEGGIPQDDAAKEQRDLAERTEALDRQIESNEKSAEGSSQPEAPKGDARPESPADGTPSDAPGDAGGSDQPKESSQGDQPEGRPSEAPTPAPTQEPADRPQPTDPSQPAEGSEGSQSPAESPSGDGSAQENRSPNESQDPPFPGQENVQKAQKAMERAVEKLQQAQREGAVQDQVEAAKELAEAKARLEEILRQLREEEIERTLAQLETRVQSMLESEMRIHDETARLDQAAGSRGDRSWEIDAGKLSFEQRRVILEADKALALLREEGSSAAFPETLSQARADMDQVATRLAQAKTGAVTQTIEEDIIAALEEMLEALRQAQNEQRQRQQNAPPMASEPDEMPLVDQIAELRMIKSLQLRINRRTNRYAQLLGDEKDLVGQATDSELVAALQELAAREARLHELTRDILLGKNQ